ncbi:hypothetical protein DUNSADRAFT_12501 [Dunaliella salina]|uniref:Encoded protein n=1 Tax=Dunaliella salina TaxID=3046 RepID=A0ABQ7FRG1_DUNSA|nr:hypothetical protein DUNSADRAFT_12501 [Dunaliella salina]|eukprot:KAF5825274.1 hypothetical protein DUNSADRAFT_12501 [Dunaliella salina]
MRQRQEVPGTLRTLSLAPRHSPAAQKPPPTQPSSSPAPVAPNSAAFSTPRQQHATQSHRVPPPQPLVVPMVGSVSMPTRQMQTSSEDAHGSGRGGWGEAIREVAHMAAWVMRQMDSSSHGRP